MQIHIVRNVKYLVRAHFMLIPQPINVSQYAQLAHIEIHLLLVKLTAALYLQIISQTLVLLNAQMVLGAIIINAFQSVLHYIMDI